MKNVAICFNRAKRSYCKFPRNRVCMCYAGGLGCLERKGPIFTNNCLYLRMPFLGDRTFSLQAVELHFSKHLILLARIAYVTGKSNRIIIVSPYRPIKSTM